MNYFEMPTEQLETLKATIEEKLDGYIGMSFASSRSEFVTYEIDSVDTDEIVINANHYFNGLIRDYIVTIDGGIDDDVEYSKYIDNGDLIDGGYMPFERLQKNVRYAVIEIYELYKDLETINNILDARAEETEEKPEEKTEEETEEPEGKDKGVNTMMNRIDAYNAYTVDRDFRYIANALGFHGFAYDDEDYDFRTKLEQDEELGGLLEQFEDIESSQFLIYTCTKVKFYERHEYDILAYLKTYGYDDNDSLHSIEDIMCSRVVAYVTGVLSEYGY